MGTHPTGALSFIGLFAYLKTSLPFVLAGLAFVVVSTKKRMCNICQANKFVQSN
jgi:hypothetical protein